MTNFIYCFIRKDLNQAQQIIQLAHAAFDAGKCFGGAVEAPPSICLFEVENQKELLQAAKHIKLHKLKYEIFYEPTNGVGFTSIVTQPVSDAETRAVFSDFKLFRNDLSELIT